MYARHEEMEFRLHRWLANFRVQSGGGLKSLSFAHLSSTFRPPFVGKMSRLFCDLTSHVYNIGACCDLLLAGRSSMKGRGWCLLLLLKNES